MRVVAGSAKGRRLQAPQGDDVRPTSDRVREALFSSLESIDAVRDAVVLDLFAGTGALGIEALSRGASHATFVDDSRLAISAIRANLEATRFAGRASVLQAESAQWLRAYTGPEFDLVLADPPYRYDAWDDLVSVVRAGVLVVESDREVPLGDAWEVLRCKRYGSTVVAIATPKGPS